jgi:hypothetical protein
MSSPSSGYKSDEQHLRRYFRLSRWWPLGYFVPFVYSEEGGQKVLPKRWYLFTTPYDVTLTVRTGMGRNTTDD